MSPKRRRPELSEPIENEIEDGDDLVKMSAALDVIATRLARHHRWEHEPDIETEPLDSLIARALDVVPKTAPKTVKRRLEGAPEAASELALVALSGRYDGIVPTAQVKRAERLRADLYDALITLERYL